jgi:uncharacterized protein (TIGR02421 family)
MDNSRASPAYLANLRELSERLVEAQRPIRILDAIHWDDAVQARFLAGGCRELPRVDRDYYQSRPLGFEPAAKHREFEDLERDIERRLGRFSPVAQILRRTCDEYQTVVRMLEARGTAEFSRLSHDLYGAASDVFHAGDPTIADLGALMFEALENIDQRRLNAEEPRTISGEEAVGILQTRFDCMFPDSPVQVRVILSDGIVADASAGSDYLKIRRDARFNPQDLRVLEVHEGWVHICTNLNGRLQPYCTFLSKGPPSATVTQEGLAILNEVFSFACHTGRLRRLTNRIRAVDMAERGADFLEVFEFFCRQGFEKEECFALASRIFRGSTPGGGPFTKDLAYSKGFVQVYNYIQIAVRRGMLDRIPLLFCGKTALEDLRTLAGLVDEGVVVAPRYLPPQFVDLDALTAWMCFSNFLNRLNLQQVELDYANIL